MKQLSVRGVDKALADRLREEARHRNLSLNRVVLQLLREATGLSPRQATFHDLDHLAGTWSEEEYSHFQSRLAEQRRIDPEMWD